MPVPGSVLALLYNSLFYGFLTTATSYGLVHLPLYYKPSTVYMPRRGVKFVNSAACSGVRMPSWPPLIRRKFHVATMTFRIVKGLCPEYLKSHVRLAASVVTGRDGRNVHRIYVPAVRTNFGKNAFCFRATGIWNRLDSQLYDSRTVSSFKSLYKILNQ